MGNWLSSSVPSSVHTIITTPTLNLSNNRTQILSKSALHRASIPAKFFTDRASSCSKAVTDNTTRIPGYSAPSFKTNQESSRIRPDNHKTLTSSKDQSSSSRTINQHSRINTNRKTPIPVRKNPEILSISNTLYNSNINLTENVFQLEILSEDSCEYDRMKSKFFQSNRSFFKLHSIEKVHNPYLLLQYGLKKSEYDRRGISYKETLLFHGTKKVNIEDICETNFDWRLHGK
uniref:Protein mono-ADP-ribosyltransferase PARP11-like n=1 Tax=Diabrotica virgifera virgifera TaxID=50390 RepID=A0A6P7G0H3_DIAVI